MKINKIDDIKFLKCEVDGANKCEMKVLMSSPNMIMRLYRIAPGGNTPHHHHEFEHIIKIHSGVGIIINASGHEIQVDENHVSHISANSMHQFKNKSDQDFEFICIIPNPEIKNCD